MKTPCTVRAFFLFGLLGVVALTTSESGELSGTRPGIDGQPLTLEGALFLLDVSKIDGADQSFTADVFMMLRWQDVRLASEAQGLRRMPLSSV